jgi:hypothetical protein
VVELEADNWCIAPRIAPARRKFDERVGAFKQHMAVLGPRKEPAVDPVERGVIGGVNQPLCVDRRARLVAGGVESLDAAVAEGNPLLDVAPIGAPARASLRRSGPRFVAT